LPIFPAVRRRVGDASAVKYVVPQSVNQLGNDARDEKPDELGLLKNVGRENIELWG
jgi:hypothetical protein